MSNAGLIDPKAYEGSITTGNTRSSPVSQDSSATTSIWRAGDAVRPTREDVAATSNSIACSSPRSPGISAEESHIVGAAKLPTASPRTERVTAPISPSNTAAFVRTRVGRDTWPVNGFPYVSASPSAALAVLTTQRTSKPAERTSTVTSTPGSTSTYVATEPSRTGSGIIRPSSENPISFAAPLPITTSSSSPEPSRTSTGIATGTTPSEVATSVVSISRHPSTAAESINRTGAKATSWSTTPSGLTNTRVVSDRSDNTSTRTPCARAVTVAEVQSGRDASTPGGSFPGSAAASATTPWPMSRASDTHAHRTRRDDTMRTPRNPGDSTIAVATEHSLYYRP